LETTRPGEVGILTKDAVDRRVDVIFMAGGDGTIGAAMDALAGTDVCLGIIPIGTANVWAAELGLPRLSPLNPKGVDPVISAQVEGIIRQVDLGRCNGKYFLLWAGIGLDAHLVHRVEPRSAYVRPFGTLHYSLAAFGGVSGWESSPIQVISGDETVSCQALLTVFTNIRLYAGGWGILDQEARADDGQLTAWVFSGQHFSEILLLFFRFLRGQHSDLPGVKKLIEPSFEFIASKPLEVQLDGDYVGEASHLFVDLVPASLRVLVPRGRHPNVLTAETFIQNGNTYT